MALRLLSAAKDAELSQPGREGLDQGKEVLSRQLDLVGVDVDVTRVAVTAQQIHDSAQSR